MGRPDHVKPAPVGGNRRDFFKRSSSVAVALTAAPMLPLGSVALAASVNTVFQHGVASGDVPFHGGAKAGVEIGVPLGDQAKFERTASGAELGDFLPREVGIHGGGIAMAARADNG